MTPPPVLRLQKLRFAHPGDAPLFDHFSLTLAPGVHRLQGESGSGKTTLLRLLADDLPGALAAAAQASLNGQVQAHDSAAWQRAVCWVDARAPAFDALTPAAVMAQVQQRHPQLDQAAWQRHIAGFGLAPHAAKTMHMLSTGMRRKAVLAAVLAAGATLTLLDEPGAGLDAPALAWLVQALHGLGRQPQRAVLMVSGLWPDGLGMAGEVVLVER